MANAMLSLVVNPDRALKKNKPGATRPAAPARTSPHFSTRPGPPFTSSPLSNLSSLSFLKISQSLNPNLRVQLPKSQALY